MEQYLEGPPSPAMWRYYVLKRRPFQVLSYLQIRYYVKLLKPTNLRLGPKITEPCVFLAVGVAFCSVVYLLGCCWIACVSSLSAFLNSPKGRNKVSHHPNRGAQPAAPVSGDRANVLCLAWSTKGHESRAGCCANLKILYLERLFHASRRSAHWPISGAFSIPGIAPNWKCASDKLTGTSGSKGHCGQHIRILRWLRRTPPTLPRTSW
jgi:hypothetical protein